MTHHVQSMVHPLIQKWDGFLLKVKQRNDEISHEAIQGLDQLIEQHSTDFGPMGAAFSALQGRFKGISDKVDEAWEKIDEEIDQISDQLSDEETTTSIDHEFLYAARDAMQAKYSQLLLELEMSHATISTRKSADWARRLYQLAVQEQQKSVSCSQCGAPLLSQSPQTSCQVRCPNCQAVNDVYPGIATNVFYHGHGVHALAHEAAWDSWYQLQIAERHFNHFRHPTTYDFNAYLQAVQAYWIQYYQTTATIFPPSAPDISKAVEGKMAFNTKWQQPLEIQKRDFLAHVIDASSRNDVNQMNQLISSLPHFVSLTDCIECLVEHQHLQTAQYLLGIQFDQEGEEGNKNQWIAEQLLEVKKLLGSNT